MNRKYKIGQYVIKTHPKHFYHLDQIIGFSDYPATRTPCYNVSKYYFDLGDDREDNIFNEVFLLSSPLISKIIESFYEKYTKI